MMEPQTPRVGAKADWSQAQRMKANRRKSQDLGSFNPKEEEEDDHLGLNSLDLSDPADFIPLDDSEILLNEDKTKVMLLEKASQIESLDYEIYENAVYRGKQNAKGPNDVRIYLMMRWFYPLLIGSLTGFFAFIINLSVENIAGFKFHTTNQLAESSTFLAFIFYMFCDVSLTIIATIMTTFVSPAAAGSGIPDVKAYLNGINLPGALLVSTLFTKVIGSICAIAGGLAVGKEGPTVHIGSCIAAIAGQGGFESWQLKSKWLKMFQNDRDRRDLITIGAAAGVAAAFKAPVGGVLFVIEEASSWMRPKLLWRCFFGNAVVHITLRALRTWCEDGGCGKFGKGGFIIFNIKEGQFDYSPYEIIPVILIGCIGGLLGTVFIKINTKICVWRRTNSIGWRRVGEAAMVAVLTAMMSFILPMMVTCQPCPEFASAEGGEEGCPGDAPGHYVNFHCPSESEGYNDLATIFFNTQDDAIRNLFMPNSEKIFRVSTLLFFMVAYFILAVVTYGLAVPSGLFIPCILCGCSYGRLVGIMVVDFGFGASSNVGIEEGTYALLGAASFLGGSMRMTISLCVILVELTNNIAFLPLLMIVLLVSKAVGDQFGIGIYDVHCGLKFAPILEEQPESFMRHLKARDVMSKDVVSFAAVERVGYIIEALQNTTHNAFPVVLRREASRKAFMTQEEEDDEKHDGNSANSFGGVVLRSHLLWCLMHRQFQEGTLPKTRAEMAAIAEGTISYEDIDFSTITTGKPVTIDDVPIIEEDIDKFINLLPFINPQPYVVPQSMGLSKTYSLFRTLGLRHLFVVPNITEVVGVITRKDLLPEFAEVRYDTIQESDGERAKRSQDWREKAHSAMDAGDAAVPWSPRNRARTPPRERKTLSVETDSHVELEGSEDSPILRR